MVTTIAQRNELTRASQSSGYIILAEANDATIGRLQEALLFYEYEVKVCRTLLEFREYTNRSPDLLLVGTLADTTCLEALRSLDGLNQDLPIIVLVEEAKVNPFFRDWVVQKGAYDVLSSHDQALFRLLETIDLILSKKEGIDLDKKVTEEPIYPTTKSDITYAYALNILNQINRCSLKYFGKMAVGNYWRKSQKILAKYTWISVWEVDHKGEITYPDTQKASEILTNQEVEILQAWLGYFILECDRIINNYHELLIREIASSNTKDFIHAAVKLFKEGN